MGLPDANTLLLQKEASALLVEKNYPIKPRYFDLLCAGGKGPQPDAWFGKFRLYRPETILAWAAARTRYRDRSEAA